MSNRNYLAEYDAAPTAQKYPLVKGWMETEPLPFFKQLRAERPILITPECVLVAKFCDIRDALQMPKIFTVDLYKSKMGVSDDDPGYLMAHDDDALHHREKSLMQGMLNRDDIPRVRELIAKASDDILTAAAGSIEVVNDYCRSVPTTVVQDYFGLDGIDKKTLIKWSFWNQYDAFHNQPFDLNSPEKYQHIIDEHNAVSGELVSYITKLMARKLVMVKAEQAKNIVLVGWYALKALINKLAGRKPAAASDDIVTRMLRSSFAKEVDFSLLRVGVNAGGLLIGAIETTSQAVAQTLQFFLAREDLLPAVRAAALQDNVELFDKMVWEALRFVPIAPYVFRRTSQSHTLAKASPWQTTIHADSNILLLTQSAMFDDYAYDQADEFQADRNYYHHFNFGFGSHECLGKYVGMAMIPEMLRQILRRPELQAASAMDYKDGPFPEHYRLRW
ncbi:MAG: cytochrome P450 [Zhongshania sp.]|uniref:cytochrome P450 n=1 Tax=Zhongshania sp. TaxID=1971902 RepID=UPI00260EED85|nr:cytochrome P450 [Zhongshania sp.]MDF1693596.1 cytochrome P450 [Zhongshania sp.]